MDGKDVLEFIHRRFPVDCNWTTGNCYHFAVILQYCFPIYLIYYDYVPGHFIVGTRDKTKFYDYNGEYSPEDISKIMTMDEIYDLDKLWWNRILRDCIK